MCFHGKIAGSGDEPFAAALLVQYEMLEECILSGQVPDVEVHGLFRGDPGFAHWFKARMPNRLRGCVSSTS